MRRLVIPREILEQIRRIVYQTDVETGLSLLGAIDGDCVVKAIIEPGGNPVEEAYRYRPDNDYENAMLNSFLDQDPTLQWIGELHVHPAGMTWLSSTDRKTIQEILLGGDADTLHPETFIAGVMQRVNGGVKIYPFLFTRDNLKGEKLYVSTKPRRERSALDQTRLRYRLWQRRLRRR